MSLNRKFIEKVFFELESGSEVLDLNGEYKLYINATITGKSRNLLRHTMLSVKVSGCTADDVTIEKVSSGFCTLCFNCTVSNQNIYIYEFLQV